MHTISSLPQIPAKSILIRNQKPSSWFGCDFNINLYRGCVHGCIYCDSRSDCYHISDFESISIKQNALAILKNELSKKSSSFLVATGAMSDPYNPYEKDLLLTRHALELLSAYDFGAAISTKSDLIIRDLDVLLEITENAPVLCKITITTLSDDLAGKIEPGAPSPSRRLAALEQLSRQGVFSGVLLMPVLPHITDDPRAIRALVEQVAHCGARFIYPAFGVTMRAGQREYFLQQLDSLYPDEKMGQKYRKTYGSRYHCASPRARECWQMFEEACQSHGVLYHMQDIIAASRQGYRRGQLSFFEDL